MSLTLKHRQPTIDEYHALRDMVGWGVPEASATRESIENAQFSVCLEKDGKLVGLGRVVGDGGLYFYIQDVIVAEEYRGLGYATMIMDEVMEYLKAHAKTGSFVGLFSTKGVEGLYEKYGFIRRPNEAFGAGMMLPIENLVNEKNSCD